MLTSWLKTALASVLAAGMSGAGVGWLYREAQADETPAPQAAPAPAAAKPLIDADFSKGDFAALGWKAKGDWDAFMHPPKTPNNPGAVARFPANKPGGSLTKTFEKSQKSQGVGNLYADGDAG